MIEVEFEFGKCLNCLHVYLFIFILQNPYLYQEAATTPTNQNIQQHLYLPSAGGSRKATHRIPSYIDDKIKKIKQPQKLTKNVFVTPLVDVVVPQQTYQLNSDVYSNEVSFVANKKPTN